MIKNEQYYDFLKAIISCISYGDYYSVKELATLEVEKLNEIDKKKNKKIKVNHKKINLEKYDKKELEKILEMYSKYVREKIEQSHSLKTLQNEFLSIEEFLRTI